MTIKSKYDIIIPQGGQELPKNKKGCDRRKVERQKERYIMTNREFYIAIANGTMNDEIKAFAEEAIRKMVERNVKRSSKPSKTSIENAPIKESIMEFISNRNEFCIASAIAEALEISTSKASALCRQLVADGKLVEKEVKIPKQGKRKAYGIEEVE